MCKSFLLKNLRHLVLIILLSYVFAPAICDIKNREDSLSNKSIPSKTEELIRGERLFYGLVYLENKSINCAGCHNTSVSDTLNWNPDALEISNKYLEKTDSELGDVLLNPAGEKMAEVHNGFQFTPEDIVLLKTYMDHLTVTGLKKSKPIITNLFLFILAAILLLFSLTDLIIIKKVKKQWIHLVILLTTGIFITSQLVVNAIAIGHSPDYAPDQPIKFSHKIHAGQNKTDCIYCHSFGPYSKSAGFPPENVCMNCHLLVRNGTRSGAFEIDKIVDSYDNMKPIEWVKVYNLPDHVFFSHAQHISAGQVTCQECHGSVENMDRISLSNELTMGWCINCHRTKIVNFENNKFYSDYKDLSEKISRGMKDSVTVADIGGTECMKCHY